MWRVELCAGCRGCSTGYAFYHVQAADKAVRDGALRLFFGYFAEEATDDEILEVGHRVSECLRAAGLSVEWDEDAHETILIKDLTDAERRYISKKMGPENRKFAKWAREMADQIGPVSGGEVHHDCDCMEYTCFCGKVKDLVEAQRVAYGTPSEDSTDESKSEWTDCSESELADMMKHAYECSDANCGCASGGTQGQNVPKDVFL